MTGQQRIVAERQRQVQREGYTAKHDDGHSVQELLSAAASYACCVDCRSSVPVTWPWESSSWKPKDRLRNLERAGALYLAVADREERLGGNGRTYRSASEGVAKLIDELLASQASAANVKVYR